MPELCQGSRVRFPLANRLLKQGDGREPFWDHLLLVDRRERSQELPFSLTRPSLLFRVREWNDSVSWEEFHRLYRRLIYGRARRAGLSHADAEDVAQDVFKRVAETIRDWIGLPSISWRMSSARMNEPCE